jgi:hypothetical protein
MKKIGKVIRTLDQSEWPNQSEDRWMPLQRVQLPSREQASFAAHFKNKKK